MECLFFVFKNYIQFLLDLQKGLHPNKPIICCCSVAKSYLTLWDPMDCMQHTRLACPSLSPRVCSNSCPLSR